MRYIVTGGMGFFGSILMDRLIECGHDAHAIDWIKDEELKNRWPCLQVDIGNRDALDNAIKQIGQVDGIFHLASVLAHDSTYKDKLWNANVEGTRNVMTLAKKHGIGKVVFTSSNCVFGTGFSEPVDESTKPGPVEIYGKSKLEAEKIIQDQKDVKSVIIRCPTIIAAGRLGLLSILFDFVREGRRIYLVGGGSNRYSFIGAADLASACIAAMQSEAVGLYHISSDNVPPLRQIFSDLIVHAKQQPKLVTIPKAPSTMALSLLHKLGLSPLGPYHYRMIAANFVFDNTKIKRELNWQPTLTNSEILCEAYDHYIENMETILNSSRSTHRSKAQAGILHIVRLLS